MEQKWHSNMSPIVALILIPELQGHSGILTGIEFLINFKAEIVLIVPRWIGTRIDLLAGLFSAGLAAYLVYGRSTTASNTGFSLAMAGTLYCTLSAATKLKFLQWSSAV